MKKYSTLLLKVSIFLVFIPIFVGSIIFFIFLLNNPVNAPYQIIMYPVIFGLYGSTIPFYLALFFSYKILLLIDHNQTFSDQSVSYIDKIKWCAIAFGIIYIIILPFVYLIAEEDDAPGLIIIGMSPIFASFVVALFATILATLFKDAMQIKDENDLTV